MSKWAPTAGMIADQRRGGMREGFTLVEILIVVVILGILATIVIPQFSNASMQARENTLKDELRYLRTQIVVYRAQHRDINAGAPTDGTSAARFLDQLTRYTNEAGATNATYTDEFKYGPYLSRMPENPITQKSGIKILAAADPVAFDADPNVGWLYRPSSGEIFANVSGADDSGTSYLSY